MAEKDSGNTTIDIEGNGQSAGVPAAGAMDVGAHEPLGASSDGKRHWRESTITEPGLNNRGNVFFAAIEMTRMPMILTDPHQPDNPIVFANKAFLDLTLYEEEEVLGRNCRFLQGARTDSESVAELRDAVAANQSIALEILNYKRDGTPFWNAVFIGPVYDTSGKLLYFFASQLDVTRRRESERSYLQAQKMEAVGQLTAGLAHDFNNLLQVVNGNLELAVARSSDERVLRYLASARGAAERGAKLTGQLLAFARKTRLDPRPVDVSECLNSFADVMESALGKKVELHFSLRRGLPKALLDPQQLEMAVLNIALNAKDAMPTGGVIELSTARVRLNGDAASRGLSPGEYVAVQVRDEGEGMTPEVIERAVEPFFTTKGVGKGTGLGLAMASGFVQQSRGRLEIESTPGKGTTVRMLFPVAARDERDLAPEPQQNSKPASSNQSGAHILVVEDSPEVLALAREILEEVGYRITTAETGEEGLAAFRSAPEESIDLVFTDLVMPGGINGIVLAQEIAKIAPDVPVLMTTGYNEELVADGPLRSGLDVLGKPYRRADLLDRVRQALNRKGDGGPRRHISDYGSAEE
ncbi:ATP-binding protein [Sphingomonas sp. IC4-52]|uniref:ATP-binding protein n=1 Tax=Sphingomonas sp. IC4-52 TaxID=2887202 RepID=UPI001D12C5CC|nr:ATP-binding protein [Sphingomonas sp. IC4-52]MCC2980656.1 response regulator [Sphingomonas sp. IC4-52]